MLSLLQVSLAILIFNAKNVKFDLHVIHCKSTDTKHSFSVFE